MVKFRRNNVEKRDRMSSLAVRAKDNDGYIGSLNAVGTRVSGSAAAFGDDDLVADAVRMSEPDWSKVRLIDLIAAEKMALHRVSGGERSWRDVLSRIRIALKKKR